MLLTDSSTCTIARIWINNIGKQESNENRFEDKTNIFTSQEMNTV